MSVTQTVSVFEERVDLAGGRVAVAAQLGCTPQAIGAIIRGESLPSLRMAAAIERSLNIPASSWVPARGEDSRRGGGE